MLEYLHVKNLALIKECELNFTEGLNVLTGETGAGKSILLGSVNLALGARADRDMIRSGETEAYVELGFSVNDAATEILKREEISAEDNSVFIQRKFTDSKNIFKVNGEVTSSKLVKELAGCLLDIHGQHEHQSLLNNVKQREILDSFGSDSLADVRNKTSEACRAYKALADELVSAREMCKGREREISLLEYECNEIEDAKLVPGEDNELEEAYKRMLDAGKLLELTNETLGYISNDASEDAGSLISRAIASLKRASSYDASLNELEQKLSECESLLGDFAMDMSGYISSLEFSDEEFATTEERLNIINSLKARFGNSIDEILKAYEAKSSELEKLKNYDEYLADLERRTEESRKLYVANATELTKLRKLAANDFSAALTEELKQLNFNSVDFYIDVSSNESVISLTGFDAVEFMISTNPGEPVKPMRNVASGGELSRIMLGIKTIIAAKDEIDALIFDEIDTGISGRTAWEVGKKLSRLSKAHQVILITHLSQISAFGDTHFLIEKNVLDGKTVTSIDRLDDTGTINELARMIGSDELAETTVNNALQLKAKADMEKEKF